MNLTVKSDNKNQYFIKFKGKEIKNEKSQKVLKRFCETLAGGISGKKEKFLTPREIREFANECKHTKNYAVIIKYDSKEMFMATLELA